MSAPRRWESGRFVNEDDWNALIDDWDSVADFEAIHPATYIIWMNGTTCEAVDGATGTTAYTGTVASVWQSVVDACVSGGLIKVKTGGYDFGTTAITIPEETKCLRIAGDAPFGKGYEEGGGYTGVHLITSGNTLFTNAYTEDQRSVWGLEFERVKFEGPATAASVCADLYNVDGFAFTRCSFSHFGTAINSNYAGDVLAEQPGAGDISHCQFHRGYRRYVWFEKNTQVKIRHNMFQGFGPFTNAIYGIDSDKMEVHGNEFNVPTVPANLTEYIKVEYGDAGFYAGGWYISDNWVYRALENCYWIRTAGTETLAGAITSCGNHITHGYTPDLIDETGPYVVHDYDAMSVVADDVMVIPVNHGALLRDHSADCPANVAYQNKWSPVTLHYTVTLSDGDSATLQLGYTSATLANAMAEQVPAGEGAHQRTMTMRVPTLYWWKLVLTGAASQDSLMAMYG